MGKINDNYATTVVGLRDDADIKLSDQTAGELAKRPILILASNLLVGRSNPSGALSNPPDTAMARLSLGPGLTANPNW